MGLKNKTMKQTAVEWFQEQIIDIVNGRCELSEIEIFNKAKEMEKEQLGNAFLAGGKSRDNLFKGLEFQTIEEYIEETFRKI